MRGANRAHLWKKGIGVVDVTTSMLARTGRAVELSLVIPAYNEERRLLESLTRVRAYLDAKPYGYEVIVVDDGSTDMTSEVVARCARDWPELRLLSGRHRGKGAAVRAGILASHGVAIAIADADLSMPIEHFDRFETEDVRAIDLAIGSREASGALRVKEPGYRHLMGRAFNRLVQLVLVPGVEDTQCGFKRMRREVALDVSRYQTVNGWGFDVEWLYIARLRGYTVREVPIPWYYVPGSRVSPARSTLTMLGDIARIRWNGLHGRYARQVPVPDFTRAHLFTRVPRNRRRPA